MRILITGGAGFIAHHLVEYVLLNTDFDIVTLDRLDFSGNLNRLKEVVSKYEFEQRVKVVYHDLKSSLNPSIVSMIGNIDYIAHLAAGSHVDRSIDYPMEFVQDNTVGTVNLLEYARDLKGLKKFLYFSTDEVFGPAPKGVRYKEYDRYNSTNPYSASKAAAEEFCVAYRNTYNLPVIVTHTMNVFGERQHPEKYIPSCIRKIRDGDTVYIHSNKKRDKAGSRFYIHANDVSSAVVFLLNKELEESDICPKFNIVGAEEIDNLELAKRIAYFQGKELKYEMVDFHSSRPGHDLRYALCGEKMKSIGWEPSSLTKKLNETISWTLENTRWL